MSQIFRSAAPADLLKLVADPVLAETLEPLEVAGTRVLRTDEDGEVAVVADRDGLSVVTR